MPVSYPEHWITRVEKAPKLVLSDDGVYRSPDGRQKVQPEEVTRRLAEYTQAEARRRNLRKLTRDDERVCRDFILVVDNWRTGAWDVPRDPPVWTHAPKVRARPASAARAATA